MKPTQRSNWRWIVTILGAVLGVTVIVGGLLWATGFLNFSGDDATAKVVIAVVALFGSLFATTVTLIGLLLRRSFEERTFILQNDAEERLKLDTAIKAVELFKSAKRATSPVESAGALFALVVSANSISL